MPRWGRSQLRNSDQNPSMVCTWTSPKPSPSSSRAYSPRPWLTLLWSYPQVHKRASIWRRAASSRGHLCEPVARDVLAARKPSSALLLHVLQHLLEAADPRRAADDPRVQPDREHLWLVCAFLPEPVERVDDVPGEIGPAHESIAVEETHVVGIEGVRQHEMRLACDLDVVRRVIIVGVGVVEEAPVLDEQAARIDRGGGLRVP